MSISIIPPITLTTEEKADILTLEGLLGILSSILDKESLITPLDRTMSTDSIDSLNNTLIDASDRIDAIINPTSSI